MQTMQNETGIRSVAPLLADLSLSETSAELAEKYQKGTPYPNLTIDNMFKSEMLEGLLQEKTASKRSDWVLHNSKNMGKLGQKSAAALGPCAYEFVSFLNSAPFLYLLSEITGIWNLLPDPYMHGAGYSIIPPGSKFDVHLDLNADKTIGLIRRVVLLVYLNHDWKPEYGGQLELWNKQGTAKVSEITPIFNRTVLMEVSDEAYHGINPVTEPTGRSRHSFMVYYNVSGGILTKDEGVHSSMYAPVCYQPKPTIGAMARRWMPPVLFDLLRQKIT